MAAASAVAKAGSKAMRTAATIVVAAPYRAATSSSALAKSEYRVLFIKRSDKMHFMSSAHVFPGGVVEASDHSPAWHKALGLSAGQQATTKLQPNELRTEESEQLGFRIAALRELFEETGLLLARPANATAATTAPTTASGDLTCCDLYDLDASAASPKDSKQQPQPQQQAAAVAMHKPGVADSVRAAVHNDATQFYTQLYEQRGLVPDVGRLFPLSRWVTPKTMGGGKAAKRFDTWFYVALLSAPPPEHMISADTNETSAVAWHALQQVVTLATTPAPAPSAGTDSKHSTAEARPSISLPPPTAHTVQDLLSHNAQTLASLQSCVLRRRLTPYTPTAVESESVTLAGPGDHEFVALTPPAFEEPLPIDSYTGRRPYTVPGGLNRVTLQPTGWFKLTRTVSLQWPETAAAGEGSGSAAAPASDLGSKPAWSRL